MLGWPWLAWLASPRFGLARLLAARPNTSLANINNNRSAKRRAAGLFLVLARQRVRSGGREASPAERRPGKTSNPSPAKRAKPTICINQASSPSGPWALGTWAHGLWGSWALRWGGRGPGNHGPLRRGALAHGPLGPKSFICLGPWALYIGMPWFYYKGECVLLVLSGACQSQISEHLAVFVVRFQAQLQLFVWLAG